MIIDIKKFLSYDSVTIDIPKGLSMILGRWVNDNTKSNGSGKTGLIDAVKWCYWGEGRTTKARPSGDDMINRPPDGKTMQVTIDYDSLRVSRSRKYESKTKLEARINNKPINGNIDHVYNQISNKLGMSYDTFLHSFYIPVGGVGAFTRLGPTEAKRKVSEMLALSRWTKRHEAISKKVSTLAKKINDLDVSIETLGAIEYGDIGTMKIQKMALEAKIRQDADTILTFEKRKEEIENEIKEIDILINGCKADKAMYNSKQVELDTINNTITSTKKQLEAHEEALLTDLNTINVYNEEVKTYREYIDKIKKELDTLILSNPGDIDYDKEIDKLQEESKNLSVKIGSNENELSRLNTIKAKIKHNIMCPVMESTCPVLSDEKVVQTQIAGYDIQISHIEQAINGDRELRIGVMFKLDDVKGARLKWLEYDKKRSDIEASIKTYEQKIIAHESSIKYFEDSRLKHSEQIKVLEDEISVREKDGMDLARFLMEMEDNLNIASIDDNIEKDQQRIRVKNSAIYQIKTDIMNIQSVMVGDRDTVSMIKNGMDIIESTMEKIKAIKNERAEVDALYRKLVILQKAFCVDGIPTYVINMITPEIESIANFILESADQPSRISIRLKEETKTKDPVTGEFKLQDTFKIGIFDINTGGEYVYDLNSAGESFWIDFSLRLALGVCTRRHNKILLNLFMIDEGMGVLDSKAQRIFLEVLRNVTIKYDIDYVWLITHTPINYAREFVDNIIMCNRDDYKTTIEIM